MSGKKKTLTEKLRESEETLERAQAELKRLVDERNDHESEAEAIMSRPRNERIRARTQYMLGQQSTLGLNAAHQALRQVAIYQTAISNIFKAAKVPILVCPNCGHVWTARQTDDVAASGYRLCDSCIVVVPDPWASKSEYALAK